MIIFRASRLTVKGNEGYKDYKNSLSSLGGKHHEKADPVHVNFQCGALGHMNISLASLPISSVYLSSQGVGTGQVVLSLC